MADKVALITGVTGQDGAYLAEFLLEKSRAVQHLPNEGFAGGDIAVGLHPQ